MFFCTDTCSNSLSPFIDGIINNSLPELWPYAVPLVNVVYVLLVHTVLKTAPNSVVYWIQVGAVRWPEVKRDEFWRDLTDTQQWHMHAELAPSPAGRQTGRRSTGGSMAASVGTAGCYALSILNLGSTKINLVQPSIETTTDTMTDLVKAGWVHSRRSAAMSRFLVSRRVQRQSFWWLSGTATVNIFSSQKKMKGKRLSVNSVSDFFVFIRSSCARRFSTHFKHLSAWLVSNRWMLNTTFSHNLS